MKDLSKDPEALKRVQNVVKTIGLIIMAIGFALLIVVALIWL